MTYRAFSMDLIGIGKIIKEARISKNLTQRELANSLFVTDKAISKWERGLSFPSSNILHKLSNILDIDLEEFLVESCCCNLVGVIKNFNWDNFLFEEIGKQKVIDYILSIFALLNIHEIYFEKEIISNDKYPFFRFNYGNAPKKSKLFIIEKPVILFGANLTRFLTNITTLEENISLLFQNKETGISFVNDFKKPFKTKNFGRGYLYFEINFKTIKDIDSFVKIYNLYNVEKFSNLKQIIKNRE